MKLLGRRGFSLLEMIIVLSILAFLTINIAVAIRNGFRARARIEEQVLDMSQVRDSLRVIERDLNLAFHYRDLEEEFRAEIKKAQSPTAGTPPGQPPQQPPQFFQPQLVPPADPKEAERKQNRVDPVTHFVGAENEMSFATLNAGRISGETKSADFIKVGYALKSCKNFVTNLSSNCLVRREGQNVEGDITKGGVEVVLIRDVTEFKLRFLGKGKQDWVSTWSSVQGDAVTKNSYPDAVELNLTIERASERGIGKTATEPKKKKISMQIVASVRFPNNQPAADNNPGAAPGAGP